MLFYYTTIKLFKSVTNMEKDWKYIRLLITRHGETQQNAKGIICGQQPGVLTKTGQEQASKIGTYLHITAHKFDQIYVSDLGRTVATFQKIKNQAKHLQNTPTIFTRLIRQKAGGILQGQPSNTWKSQADKQKLPIREYKCANGQSWADVNKRCCDFLQLLVQNHIIKTKQHAKEGVSILVVAHGGILMQFYNIMNLIMHNKQPVFKDSAKNCSLHQFIIAYPSSQQQYNKLLVKIQCIRQNFVEHLK